MASGGQGSRLMTNNDDLRRGACRQRAFSLIKDKHMDLLEFDEGIRPRTSSMPVRSDIKKPNLHHLHHRHHGHLSMFYNHDHDLNTYPVRMFEVNSKGVIKKRSDSMRSRSSTSFSSDGELCAPLSQSSLASSSSRGSTETYKSVGPVNASVVMVLGVSGVGKTALTQQFMTSEYLGGFDTSMGKTEHFFASFI